MGQLIDVLLFNYVKEINSKVIEIESLLHLVFPNENFSY